MASERHYWEIHSHPGRPRWYELRLEPDRAGGWRVVRRWGYLGCRGWRLIHRHNDRDAAEGELRAVAQRRERQGYANARPETGPPAEGRQLIFVYDEPVKRMRGSSSG